MFVYTVQQNKHKQDLTEDAHQTKTSRLDKPAKQPQGNKARGWRRRSKKVVNEAVFKSEAFEFEGKAATLGEALVFKVFEHDTFRFVSLVLSFSWAANV